LQPKKSRAAATRGNGKLAQSAPVAGLREDSPDARSRLIVAAIEAFRDGDFSVRLPTHWSQPEAQIAAAFNQTIAQKQRISMEVTRLSETVGKDGRLRQRMSPFSVCSTSMTSPFDLRCRLMFGAATSGAAFA